MNCPSLYVCIYLFNFIYKFIKQFVDFYFFQKVCLFSFSDPLGNLGNITEENSQEMKQNETLSNQPTEDVEMYNLNEEQVNNTNTVIL